jgi:hypothetical protein
LMRSKMSPACSWVSIRIVIAALCDWASLW